MNNLGQTRPMLRLAGQSADYHAAILRKHGVTVGWPCPDCGRAIEASDWDKDICPCGRPYPFPCGRECGQYVHPQKPKTGRWYDCYVECDDCAQRTRRGRVQTTLEAVVPKAVFAASRNYQDLRHRFELVRAGADWCARSCGRGGGWSSLYVHGNTGAGKSVGVARLVEEAMLRGIVSDLDWLLEEDLVEAAKTRFRDEDASGPARLLERARRVELLVVDELFSRGAAGYTANASIVVGSIFRSRFDEGLPTIITSNSPLSTGGRSMWSIVFDSRVESRWHAVGHEVACTGPDLRASQRRAR